MAVLQNLVVNILGNSSSFSKASRSARQDSVALKGAVSNSVTAMSAALEAPAARAQQLSFAISKSKQEVVQAKAANDALAMSLNSMAIQSSKVAQVSLSLDKAILQETQSAMTLSAVMADEGIQARQLSLEITKSANAVQLARAENDQLARSMQSGAIQANQLALAEAEMARRSMQAAQAKRQSADALQHFDRTAKISSQTMQRYSRELGVATRHQQGLTRSSGANRMAMANTIFMVEDAASVYGTMGLAGALRAASNNMTMIAMAMGGPVVAGITVGITTAIQLGMALSGAGDAAARAKKDLEKFKDELKETVRAAERMQNFENKVKDISGSDQASQAIVDNIREKKLNDKKLADLRKQREQETGRLGRLHTRDRTMSEGFFEGLEGFGLSGPAIPEIAVQEKKIAIIGEEIAKLNQRNREIEEERAKLANRRLALSRQEQAEARRVEAAKFEKEKNEKGKQSAPSEQDQFAEKLRDQALALRQSAKSPRELFQEEVARIAALHKAMPGIVTHEVASKNIEAARKKFLGGAQTEDRRDMAPSGIAKGSREAFEKIARFNRGSSNSPAALQGKANQHLARIEKANLETLVELRKRSDGASGGGFFEGFNDGGVA